MKIVLCKDVADLGEEGQVVKVSDGYARNFLLPRKMAVVATEAVVAAAAKKRAAIEKKLEERRHEFEAAAKRLGEMEIEITADAGEEGKLFGSVTSQEVAQAIRAAADLEVDKKKIELAQPIKTLGVYSARVKLFKDIVALLKIKVIAR